MANRTLENSGEQVLISFDESIKDVTQINDYEEDISGDLGSNTITKEFRWSKDGNEYSDWVTLNTNNISSLDFTGPINLWFDFLYTAYSIQPGDTITINDVTLNYNQDSTTEEVEVDVTQCKTTTFNSIIECDNNKLFNPYELINDFKPIYEELSTLTSNFLGHCVSYYRYEPNKSTDDPVLHEYGMYNYKDNLDLNILVPQNEFPSNEISYDIFGMNFNEFEIHIVRSEFENKFGEGEVPYQGDLIYFSNLNRLYEIQSVNENENPFYQNTFFRVRLDTAQDRSNKIQPDQVQQELDDLTLDSQEITDEPINEEQEQKRKEDIFYVLGNESHDRVRGKIHKDVEIKEENINNNWTIVAKNHYLLNTVNEYQTAIEYKAPIKISSNDNIGYTSWFKNLNLKKGITTQATLSNSSTYDILTYGSSSDIKFTIGDWLKIGTNYARVKEINNNEVTIDNLGISEGQYDTNKLFRGILLNGYEDNKKQTDGLEFSISEKHIFVEINNQIYKFNHNKTLDKEKWYSTIIKLSNQYNQVSVFLYELNQQAPEKQQDQNNQLKLIYHQTVSLDSNFTIDTNFKYKLLGSEIALTNIRLLDKQILEENHLRLLNDYIPSDTQRMIIVDNARKPLHLPKSSNL